MPTTDALYAELKPHLAALAEPLFDFSARCLRDRGAFLPHGATLSVTGEVGLVGATTGSEDGTSVPAEILPILHEGLRHSAKTCDLMAVGVAEDVTVTPIGQPPTQAIKVLIEHSRGLTVALYLPFKKKFLRGIVFGETFSAPASPEVNPWQQG